MLYPQWISVRGHVPGVTRVCRKRSKTKVSGRPALLLQMKTTLLFLFMIVASSGHIAPVSGHDHGSGTAAAARAW